MKISYGLTVCNEDKELENLITYLKDIIESEDEIVIVYDQNRVTSEVKQILQNYKNDCISYPFDFKQNFLENKNYLNSKCTGDYIFQIDADEIPERFLVENLKTVLEHNPVDVLIAPRKNLVTGLTQEHIQKWRWGVNEKGWVNWPDPQKRIYKNDPSIKWSGHQIHGMVSGYKTYATLPLSEEWSIIHNKTISRQEQQNDRYDKIERGNVKVVGITRIRNEEDIIQLTLDHVSKLVDEIYVYDDCSTDNTVAICESHPKVTKVVKGTTWKSDSDGRQDAEGTLRQKIYEESLKSNPDWVYYFDSDEFADFDGIDLTDKNVDSYFLRLFDYYITKDDVDTHFLKRKYMGPEYRDIMMLFRPTPNLIFTGRQPSGFSPRYKQAGYVKHYGKAITVEEWEKTCDYYINHRGGEKRLDFTNKWKERKGKAIHEKSDFGYDLIQWEQRNDSNVIIDNSQGQAEK
jgi:glycosyltransferase involved in cell wall biosynthesis